MKSEQTKGKKASGGHGNVTFPTKSVPTFGNGRLLKERKSRNAQEKHKSKSKDAPFGII